MTLSPQTNNNSNSFRNINILINGQPDKKKIESSRKNNINFIENEKHFFKIKHLKESLITNKEELNKNSKQET